MPVAGCAALAAADDYDAVRAALDAGDRRAAHAALASLGDDGDTLAMLMLANLEIAEYNRTDYGLAIAWLAEAAEAGNVRAMLELGNLYERAGPWLFPDRAEGIAATAAGYPEALHWYGLAADAGSVEALTRIGQSYRLRLYSMMDESLTPEDEDRLAREYLERAVEAGDASAMPLLALIVRRDDPERHAALVLEGARGGDPQAVGMIAARPDMFGVEDPVDAVAWAIAAKAAWELSRSPRTPLFTMVGADTAAYFLVAMDEIIAEAPPEVREAAQARADEITAGWTSWLPGMSGEGASEEAEQSGGGSFFGRD